MSLRGTWHATRRGGEFTTSSMTDWEVINKCSSAERDIYRASWPVLQRVFRCSFMHSSSFLLCFISCYLVHLCFIPFFFVLSLILCCLFVLCVISLFSFLVLSFVTFSFLFLFFIFFYSSSLFPSFSLIILLSPCPSSLHLIFFTAFFSFPLCSCLVFLFSAFLFFCIDFIFLFFKYV